MRPSDSMHYPSGPTSLGTLSLAVTPRAREDRHAGLGLDRARKGRVMHEEGPR